MNLGFSKELRLLCADDYKPVFDDAKFKISKREMLLLARPNGRIQPRLGLVIAKKNAKHAVQRNRIKRIARESFRLQQQLPCIDAVILSRRGLDKLDNRKMHQMFDQLWQQLKLKYDKSQTQS